MSDRFRDMLTTLRLRAKVGANGTWSIIERASGQYIGRLVPYNDAKQWQPFIGIGSRERAFPLCADLVDALLDLVSEHTPEPRFVCAWCKTPFLLGVVWPVHDDELEFPCCSFPHAEHVDAEWERFVRTRTIDRGRDLGTTVTITERTRS